MINNVEVLALTDKNTYMDKLLGSAHTLTYIRNYDELLEKLNNFDYINPRIVVVDIDYILKYKNITWLDIKHDLMYKNASVMICGKNISFETKQKLYSFDIKGVMDLDTGNQKDIFLHVLRKTNLYASSLRNNFVRASIKYNSLENEYIESTYLLDYLIHNYKISYDNTLNIRLALVSLFIGIKKNNINKVENFIHIAFQQPDASRLYKNHKNPKLQDEKILFFLLKFNSNTYIKEYMEDTDDVDEELYTEIENFYNSKIKIITSQQDVNLFLEQLYLATLQESNKADFQSISLFLSNTETILQNILNHTNYFVSDINTYDSGKVVVNIKITNIKTEALQEYIDNILASCDTISISEKGGYHTLCIVNTTDGFENNEKKCDKKIDKTKINSMHYKDDEKISATEFLKSFSVDYGMIDELNDNTKEISSLLYQDIRLSQETIDAIVIILQRYSSVLNETIEFRDIADSLTSLAMVFKELKTEEMGDEKKEKLNFYIQGIIDDLDNWKNYIFVTAKTPDIHYLDASLLENCLSIEKFILSNDEENTEEEDNDLEFF